MAEPSGEIEIVNEGLNQPQQDAELEELPMNEGQEPSVPRDEDRAAIETKVPSIMGDESLESEEKHNRSVAVVTQEAEEIGAETSSGVQRIINEQVDEESSAERQRLKEQYAQAQQVVVEQYQAQVQKLIDDQQIEQAIAVLQEITTIDQSNLEGLQENGTLNANKVNSLIATRLKPDLVVDALARFSEAVNTLNNAERASQTAGSQSQAEAEASISEAPITQGEQKKTDQIGSLNRDIERMVDSVDVPSVLKLVFAIEGSVSRWESYKNGLEMKEPSKEQQTLAALAKIFNSPEVIEVFLKQLVGVTETEALSGQEILNKLESLLDNHALNTPDQKAERLNTIKVNMMNGIDKCHKYGVPTAVRHASEINLSAEVIQFLLLKTQKFVEKKDQD